MPRSTLASNPRKGTAHERRTTRKPKRLTPGDTLRLRLCSPLAKHFESQGETLVLGLGPCGTPASAQAKYPPARREPPTPLTGTVGNWSRGWSLCRPQVTRKNLFHRGAVGRFLAGRTQHGPLVFCA